MNNSTPLVRILTLILLIGFNSVAFSQKEANVWYFGTHAGLNFNTTPVSILTNGATNAGTTGAGSEGEGYASLSDAAGNLMMYTDGTTIWNKNHVVMTGGAGLNGALTTAQSALIIPKPGSTTNFYVFTMGPTTATVGLYYNEVNFSAANLNLGEVILKNQPVWTGIRTMEALTAVPHRNGNDIWVLCHGAITAGIADQYRAYRVTSTGPQTGSPVITSIGFSPSNGQGTLKVNSCFNKVALTMGGMTAGSNRVEITNFDNNTGIFSGFTNTLGTLATPLVLDNFTGAYGPYGLEFSKSGRYLYVTELMFATVSRYDLSLDCDNSPTAPAIELSKTLVGTGPHGANIDNGVQAFPRMGHLQLGPDDVIYIANHNAWHYWDNVNPASGGCSNCSNSQIISKITNPDGGGAYTATAFTFPTGYATGTAVSHGLPQIYKGFIAGVGAIEPGGVAKLDSVCVGEAFALNGIYNGTGSNWKWYADQAGTGVVDGSPEYTTQNVASHIYTTGGTKKITLTFDDATCLYPVEALAEVVVSPKVNAIGTLSCGPPVSANVVSPGAHTYVWYADAAYKKPIGTGTTNVNLPIGSSGNVYVRAETSSIGTPVNPILRNTGTINTYGSSTPGTTVNFTVTNAITLNSFQWGHGSIPGWPYPSTNYTVSVQNAAGTFTYYTKTYATANGSSTYNSYTESGLNLVLPAGAYRILYSSIGQDFSANTNASDANVSITGNPGKIGNFNYSRTNYAVTGLNCSSGSSVAFNCPLPVSFLYFTAEKNSKGVVLQWSTASETNNNYFVIERSLDGENFESVGQVKGAGNSSQILTYYFTDSEALQGTIYYRIMQVDYDGQYSYSPVRSVNFDKTLTFSIAPNPTNGEFVININSGQPSEKYTVEVLTVLGVVISKEEKGNSENSIRMNLQDLAKGVYMLKVSNDNVSFINKIVLE